MELNKNKRNKPVFGSPEERQRWRFDLAEYALAHGITAAAREYGTTRKTVRLWLKRFHSEDNDRKREIKPARATSVILKKPVGRYLPSGSATGLKITIGVINLNEIDKLHSRKKSSKFPTWQFTAREIRYAQYGFNRVFNETA
jgi:hypothetical protein